MSVYYVGMPHISVPSPCNSIALIIASRHSFHLKKKKKKGLHLGSQVLALLGSLRSVPIEVFQPKANN